MYAPQARKHEPLEIISLVARAADRRAWQYQPLQADREDAEVPMASWPTVYSTWHHGGGD